jgi:hypothetical protein
MPEALVQVFLLSAIEYTDQDGRLRRVGKWLNHELSPVHAERAKRFGKACDQTDPRRNELRGHSPGAPAASWCFSLDHEPASGIEADPATSQFTRIDRGGPTKMQIAG